MEYDQLFQMRHDKAWMDAIDAWRRAEAVEIQQDISRSEAVRLLVGQALARQSS